MHHAFDLSVMTELAESLLLQVSYHPSSCNLRTQHIFVDATCFKVLSGASSYVIKIKLDDLTDLFALESSSFLIVTSLYKTTAAGNDYLALTKNISEQVFFFLHVYE